MELKEERRKKRIMEKGDRYMEKKHDEREKRKKRCVGRKNEEEK